MRERNDSCITGFFLVYLQGFPVALHLRRGVSGSGAGVSDGQPYP